MPTATDVEQMDAQSAESQAKSLGLVRRDSAVSWSVDGIETSAAVARAIPGDSIAKVEVEKAMDGRRSRIFIITKARQNLAATKSVDSIRVNFSEASSAEQRARQVRKVQEAASRQGGPIVIIDGVRADPSVLKTIDRNRIDRVEVLKGSMALAVYGSDAANGVIVVTTKR